ncbi:hypothetical protein FO519_001446 [Halicephalobus sp. NKZ332]|nr:hypothetical protein FO519_001446 [Halicephalobus sp. NKZ332]
MLAPIVTKDMKLFPGRPVHTNGIKNVRSRAQSLQDFANSNTNKQRVKIAPASQRNAQSVGNLSLPNLSRSPPKSTSMRQPLAAIAEGVEFPSSSNSVTASTPAVCSVSENPKKPRSIGLDDLRIIGDKNFVDPTTEDSESPDSGKSSPSAGKRLISKLTSVFKSSKSKNPNDVDEGQSSNSESQYSPVPTTAQSCVV